MKNKIQINNKWVGDGYPTFIIAEAGSNHNRDLAQAKQLIDIAAEAGADAVKFQLFKAEKHYPQSVEKDGRKSRYQLTKEKELPNEWIPQLVEQCNNRGIQFMCSAFYCEAIDLLTPYVGAHKIASSEMNHYPLIQHAWGTQKPLIISVGMAEQSEVNDLVGMLDHLEGNNGYSLMHCTVSYPTDLKDVNLKVISSFKQRYDVPIGLSDHTTDPLVVPVAAVALGANIIEKHFTISRSLPGPDHSYALEPEELRMMVKAVRDVEAALGSGEKKVTAVEQKLKNSLRRTIFAIKNINTGEKITIDNVDILRAAEAGIGLDPKEYHKILGKKVVRDIKAFDLINKISLDQ